MGLHAKLELNEFLLKKDNFRPLIKNKKYQVVHCKKCGFPFITVKEKDFVLCKKCSKIFQRVRVVK